MRLPRQLENLARVLTYMLCHRPDEFGLVLSEEGFIPVKQVLQALSAEPGFAYVRRHHLEEVAGLLGPESFEIAGDAIRGLKPGPARLRGTLGDKPPPLLYAAIPPKVHPRVWEEGLKAPAGQELLLARQPEFALKLGRRRAPKPILVTVQAQAAAKQGITFQGYGEDLFLTPAVPCACAFSISVR
jgi:putative RNA 2'-phosphotransferase